MRLGSAISPDGQILANADYQAIKLWNLHTGQLLRTFQEEILGVAVTSIVFSLDGYILTTKSEDDTITVWDLHTGQLLRTLSGYSSRAYNIAINPDGQTLASANEDGTINVWNWPTAKLLHILKAPSPIEHRDDILQDGRQVTTYKITFSPDGQTLASVNEDGTITLWQQAGQPLHTLKAPYVAQITFSPDGQVLAAKHPDEITVWNLHTGQLLGILKIPFSAVHCFAVAPHGRTLAIGKKDGTIMVWRIN